MNTENRPPLAPGEPPTTSRQASKLNARTTPTVTPEQTRLCPISAKIGRELSQEIDAYGETHGITRSRAAGQVPGHCQ